MPGRFFGRIPTAFSKEIVLLKKSTDNFFPERSVENSFSRFPDKTNEKTQVDLQEFFDRFYNESSSGWKNPSLGDYVFRVVRYY